MSAGATRLEVFGVTGPDTYPDLARVGILDAALGAFIDFGIRRTNMAEVARRCGLSPATLYRRFDQKAGLVRAVVGREVRRFVEDADRRIDPSLDAESQIVELFGAFLDGLRGNRLLTRLLATEAESVLPLLTVDGHPVIAHGQAYIAAFIRRLQAGGKLPAFEAEPVAEMVARVAVSLALTPQTCIPLDDDAAARRFARDHICVVFRLPPAP